MSLLRFAVLLIAIVFSSQIAIAQKRLPITGDRLSGFVLPIEPIQGDIHIEALRASAWTVDETKRLLLDGDVNIRIGAYSFESASAVVWINRLPSDGGLINQIAVFFDSVDDPAKRAVLGVQGNRVLITGSTRGEIKLKVSLLNQEQPARKGIVRRAEQRLEDYLRQTLAEPRPPLRKRPQIQAGKDSKPAKNLPSEVTLPPVGNRKLPLLAPDATVWFSWDELEVITGIEENTITLTGSVVIEYTTNNKSDDISQLSLTAQRAVVFTDPGSIEQMMTGQLEAQSIRGMYLEGNVNVIADNGEYQIRAPQMYYDFQTNQAVMLEAVMRTYASRGRLPIYLRAEELRQISANQWTGENMRASTSEFFSPHLSVGARQVTVTRRESPTNPDDVEIHLESRGNTLKMGDTSLFYWPKFSGRVQDVPLKSAGFGTRDNDGFIVETKWDPFTLLGIERPEGVNASLLLDGYSKRGAGVGLTFDYNLEHGYGNVDVYGLYDDGVDRTSTGREIDQDEQYRGIALWEHTMQIDQNWSLQAQAAWISDETFITAWREDDFLRRREYESSVYLKHLKDNSAFTVLGKFDFNDFVSNDYLLASRQLQVEKLPELSYRRYGDSWFDNRITYSTETRVSRMRFNFEKSTPAELGVRGRAFGIDDDTAISDMLRSRGLGTAFVNRFDTRHEFSMPSAMGIFKVTPFLVGRITAYDDEFEDFSSEADSTRIFGAAGLRVNTQFQKIDNSVESRLFDLNRLRHIIEPSLTVWYGHTDVDQSDLPLYDPAVESLATGSVIKLAVRNTWQTQRGGPGRWRSVDVLKVDTSAVFNSNDADRESPIPQFFDYRPEYSQFGDHIFTSAIWQPSDHLAIVGEATYDLDESAIARGSIGVELRHSPMLLTFVEFRYIDISDNELLSVGWDYKLSKKYKVRLRPQWDFREDKFRAITFSVTRSFPDFDFTFRIRHDDIRDDTSFGASMDVVQF